MRGSLAVRGAAALARYGALLVRVHAGESGMGGFATLAPGFTGFFGSEFMRCALGMSCLAALAGDLALFFWVHGGEASFGCFAAGSHILVIDRWIRLGEKLAVCVSAVLWRL